MRGKAGMLTQRMTVATYVQSFSVNANDTSPLGVDFKSDGTRMYVIGNENDSVYEYSLSSAWDISTTSYLQSFSVASQETNAQGILLKSDGTRMYIVGASGTLYEYSLSSAWDISSASYVQSFSVASQDASPRGLSFSDDGSRMYVVGEGNDSVYEYSLSSAWDISTASYVRSLGVASEELSPKDVSFSQSGSRMYVLGTWDDDVSEYWLSEQWNISTAFYVHSFSVAAQAQSPQGFAFSPDRTKMYVVENSNKTVLQYSIT